MRSFPHLLRRRSVVALATIVGVAVTGLITLFACAPMTRPAVELQMNALDHTGFNVVPNHETAESIAVAVSRAMLEDTDNLEFTQFLPFNADLDGGIWTVFSNPVQPKDWGPCSESLFFVVKIIRDTGEILDLTISHSEGGLNVDTPACQIWTREQSEPYSVSAIAYFQALEKMCPNKNLERLTPVQFDFVVEQFKKSLSVLERNSFESWAQATCAANDLTCVNGGYLRAARDLNMAQRLAKKACASNFVCHSDGMACEQMNSPR
jgi:hypothetical protein